MNQVKINRYLGSSQPVLGDQVLGIVTSAMYDSPLAVYREYIQNSADALAATGRLDQGAVEVSIDPHQRRIDILDDGPGLTEDMAVRALIPIGTSGKRRGVDRGFRGIGRLCGLAFGESLTFLTRVKGSRHATRVRWNGSRLRARIGETKNTAQSVRECVEVTSLDGEDLPEHCFGVCVEGVYRHAAGTLLNRELVRSYISEVCPVPIETSFPFAANVERLFSDGKQPLAVTVSLAGDRSPIFRPLREELRLSKHRFDRFTEFEEIRVSSPDRSTVAATGWIAHSSYLGALPKNLGVRGVRVRVGNIQIGGEDVFDHLFDQDRFNRWCVGEIHIMDSRIVPNGRRDYFEASPHLRNLENHLAVLFRGIAARCRSASTRRNSLRRLETAVDDIEHWYQLVSSGWLARDDALVLAAKIGRQATRLLEKLGMVEQRSNDVVTRLREVVGDLRDFDGPSRQPLRSMTLVERRAYHHAFRAIMDATDSPRVVLRAIKRIAERMGSEAGKG